MRERHTYTHYEKPCFPSACWFYLRKDAGRPITMSGYAGPPLDPMMMMPSPAPFQYDIFDDIPSEGQAEDMGLDARMLRKQERKMEEDGLRTMEAWKRNLALAAQPLPQMMMPVKLEGDGVVEQTVYEQLVLAVKKEVEPAALRVHFVRDTHVVVQHKKAKGVNIGITPHEERVLVTINKPSLLPAGVLQVDKKKASGARLQGWVMDDFPDSEGVFTFFPSLDEAMPRLIWLVCGPF